MRTRLCLIAGLASIAISACSDSATGPSDTVTSFDLALSPATVSAGAPSQGTVTVRNRTSHDVEIQLSSSDAVASVPLSIVVPSGAASASFMVTTRLVAADTVARITATSGSTKQGAVLQVMSPVARPATLDGLLLDASTVRGGQTVEATVRLTGAAPAGGLSVRIGSSNAAAMVPASVTVPQSALTVAFTVSTRPVDLETRLEITAAFSDQTRTVSLRVTP